jgi:hypothetical protein
MDEDPGRRYYGPEAGLRRTLAQLKVCRAEHAAAAEAEARARMQVYVLLALLCACVAYRILRGR